MTLYKCSAVLRDAKGKEIGYREPLWTGEALDLRAATTICVDAARAHVADQRVDTVVLKIRGPDGKQVLATEYAEDLRSGLDTSADQTTLLRDGHATRTPDEVKATEEKIRADALEVMRKALPPGTREFELLEADADAIREYDDARISLGDAHGLDRITVPDDGTPEEMREFYQMMINGEVDLRGGDSVFHDDGTIDVGSNDWARLKKWINTRLRARADKAQRQSMPGQSVAHEISQAVQDFVDKTGRQVQSLVLNKETAQRVFERYQIIPHGGDFFYLGYPVRQDRSPTAPPIAIVPEPRGHKIDKIWVDGVQQWPCPSDVDDYMFITVPTPPTATTSPQSKRLIQPFTVQMDDGEALIFDLPAQVEFTRQAKRYINGDFQV